MTVRDFKCHVRRLEKAWRSGVLSAAGCAAGLVLMMKGLGSEWLLLPALL